MTLDAEPVWHELTAALAVVRRGANPTPQAVHRVRTSAARLVAWLELAGRRALIDDLRRLRHRAAPLRDIDVALARGAPAPMREWLPTERAARRGEFVAALRRPWMRGLVAAFPLLAAPSRGDAEKALPAIEDRVRRRAKNVSDDAPVEALHRLRRALRRLRHARDWLGEDVHDLKPTIEALGAVNDLATAGALAMQCPARAELAGFVEAALAETETARRRAVAEWRESKFARKEI